MDAIEKLMFQRRSIRKYKNEPLPEDLIQDMLRCATHAPSPSNRQPVRFVRVKSPHYRSKLQDALTMGHARLLERRKAAGASARLKNRINAYLRYSEVMFQSPVLFAVGTCTQTIGFATHLAKAGLIQKDQRTGKDLDMTVGLALKAVMLKAQALGAGSCILTAPLVFIRDVENVLDLEDISINCFLTLGWADHDPPRPPRLSLEQIVRVI
ncbi:MAG: nitroreductase family protein [Desulfobacteraceae bacterium]|nr:nitroreductase family protein [Desulfobacteraceae bacterium]